MKPVLSEAEVIQRELESCLGQEYTPESLPLLLYQVDLISVSSSGPGGHNTAQFGYLFPQTHQHC